VNGTESKQKGGIAMAIIDACGADDLGFDPLHRIDGSVALDIEEAKQRLNRAKNAYGADKLTVVVLNSSCIARFEQPIGTAVRYMRDHLKKKPNAKFYVAVTPHLEGVPATGVPEQVIA